MVKLSQQFKDQALQQQERPTRTQRVAQQQEIKKIELQRKRFESLKEQAKKIQEEKFKEKIVEETYYDERPEAFGEYQWSGMEGHLRDWHLAKAKQRGEKIISIKRTRQKTIPFTIDNGTNTYKAVYENLSPDLKQFFDSPKTVLERKVERIQQTKEKIKERQMYADRKNSEEQAIIKGRMKEYQDWWGRQPQEYRSDPAHRKRRDVKLNDWDDAIDETDAKWGGYKEGLSKGGSQLTQNKDIAFSSIESYAWEIAEYQKQRRIAQNNQIEIERNEALELKKLEEAGFEPFIIKKSFKGQPESVILSYYNPKTKQYKSIKEFGVTGKIDVSKLEKIGYSAPIQRVITFRGKEFKFKSRVGIYKDPIGDIFTPYTKTGLNESVLIKQQQDKAFKEWETLRKTKPIIVPFKFFTKKDLPIGYGGQQTISSEPISLLVDEKAYYKGKDKKAFDFGIGKMIGGIVKGFKYVDTRVHYTGSFPDLIKFGKVDKPTDPEIASQLGVAYLSKKSQALEDWAIGKGKIKEFKQRLETKYEEQYQSAFEQKYMKGLIYEETTFEEVSKEFSGSEEAKLIQRRYKEEFKTGYKELQISPSMLKKWGAGSGRVGLSLASLGLKAVSTPTKTALASGGIYGGVKLLKAIPPIISYGATGGLFVYGTYKAFSPKSSIDVAGSGLVTAVLTGATLGYASYKYLRSPVIKTKVIKPPKMSLKASEVIGRDIEVITKKGSINKIIFQNQKLSQSASAGRRTIITTKSRELLAKYTKLKPAPIYRGVPTAQIGTKAYYEKFGGLIKIGKQGAYQKAFKLLTKYGYTKYQATSTLRYIAPRVTEQFLSKGIITVKGTKAIGQFEYLTKKPIIDVDKSLGIKTRGGRTIKDIYDIKRKLIIIEGKSIALEEKTRISFILDKKGRIIDLARDGFDYSRGISVAKISKLQKGFEYAKIEKFDVFKEAKYKDILKISIERKLFPRENILDLDFSKTKLFKKVLDLTKGTKFIKPAIIKKTPFSKTFGTDKALINKISQKAGSSDINKIIKKIEKIGSPTPAQSKYFGIGKYEQSLGGLSPQQARSLQNQLKYAYVPRQTKIFKLKDLIKIKQLDIGLSKVAQLTSLTPLLKTKSDIKLKSSLKVANLIKTKTDIKIKNLLKTAQIPALKTSPALKSQLKSILDLKAVSPTINVPPTAYRLPKIPIYRPLTPIPLIFFLKTKRGKRRRSALEQAIYDKAYLPDFTSRALGLKPEIISQKQALKKLKKLLTGLEIRRSIKIK